MNKKSYNVIDLFCGCGGLSLGFEQAGFNVLLGIDMWKDALVTFSKNHKIGNTLCADLAILQAEDVEKEIGNKKIDVIIWSSMPGIFYCWKTYCRGRTKLIV